MSTQQENYFDDSIRRKLKSAEEEVPFAFDDIATKLDVNANDYLAWIRGFLFSDAILLLIAFSFVKMTNGSNLNNHAIAAANVAAANAKHSTVSTTNNITAETVAPISNTTSDNQFDNPSASLNADAATITASLNTVSANNNNSASQNRLFAASRRTNNRRTSANSSIDASLLALAPANSNAIADNNIVSALDLIAFMKMIGIKDDAAAENTIQTQDNPAQGYTPPASILFYVGAAPNSLSEINLDKNLNADVKIAATNFSAGIQLRYTLGKHTSVLTGFEYKRGHLKTSLHDSYKYDALQIDSTIGFIISPFDPPVMIIDYDTSLVSKIGEVSVNGDARISSFMFPVKLAYAWPLGSWSVEPNAGILASFNAAKNTITHNYSGEAIDYYSEKFTFNDLTYALTAGLNVSYLVSPKLKVFVAGNYLKWMNSSASYKAVNYSASPQLNGSIGIELKIK